MRIILITLFFIFFSNSVKGSQIKKNKNYNFLGKEHLYIDDNKFFYKYKFKNGLNLVIIEEDNDDIKLDILVNAGDNREIEKLYSISLNPYFSERIFLNTKTSSQLDDFYIANEEFFNFFNFLKFSYEFKLEKFDFVFSKLFKTLKNPDTSKSAIDSAKKDVLNFMSLKFNGSLYADVFKCLKDKKILEKDYKEEMSIVDTKKIKEYYSKFFTANNIIIVVETKLKPEFIVNKISNFANLLQKHSDIEYIDVQKQILSELKKVNKKIYCDVNDTKNNKFNMNINLFPNFNYTSKDIFYRRILNKAIMKNYSVLEKNENHKIVIIEDMDFPSNNYFLNSYSIMNLKNNNENFNEILKNSIANIKSSEQKIDEDDYEFDDDKKIEYIYYNVMFGDKNIFDQDKINKLAKNFDFKDFENWVNKNYINNQNVISILLNSGFNVEVLK